MTYWHENRFAGIGLRAGGLALLALGGMVAVRLHHMALVTPARDATSLTLLLSAIAFLCGSAGSALLFAGPGLWETVEVSERWRRLRAPDF
ncbi:hypothetical protein [Sphingopyxis sp. KK2]|uniref:hypothetical protein n=1 Tax=Sphingopyxis sp. KK2 TaxID=1855727 RepID=UPI00097E71D6|nr:hypothetical protein [Sphingopyxis sp. KK2]